jgi:hypothetical protein
MVCVRTDSSLKNVKSQKLRSMVRGLDPPYLPASPEAENGKMRVKDQLFADSFLHTCFAEFVNVVILYNLRDHCTEYHTRKTKGVLDLPLRMYPLRASTLAVVRHRKTKGVWNQFSNE